MKRKFLAFIMAVTMSMTSVVCSNAVVFAESNVSDSAENQSLPEIGEEIYGFKTISKSNYKNAEAQIVTFEHIKSGATLVYVQNNDENLTFNIGYNTPQTDETDRNHVFEHAIITSSDKYPSSDVFFDLANKTYNTYVNASTSLTTTNYMVSSMSEAQLKKLIDVYLSCMVAPGIMENENFFKREAINYTLESENSDIQLGGTVFSEDTGYMTDMSFGTLNAVIDALYPNEYGSNTIATAVYNYKELTYEHAKELYNMCYHFDNSIITLYGKMDYKAMLKFIDEEYLSKYERNNTDLSMYKDAKSESKFVKDVVYVPANEGDTVENASTISYSIDLDGYSYEDITKLDYITQLLNDDNSVINKNLMANGLYNSFNVDLRTDSQKPHIDFQLKNANPEDRDKFYDIIKTSIEEIAKNGTGENYKNILKTIEISDSLSTENSNYGIDFAVALTLYWRATGKTDLYEIEEKVFNELKEDTTQKNVKDVMGKILSPDNSALVAVVPKPGLAEEINKEREDYLAELKASMSDDEIKAMVEETAEYNEWNNNVISNDNVSIKPSQLPEMEDLPKASVNTIGATTNYSSVVNKNVGHYNLLFDANSIKQEDLYYLALYNYIVSNIGTENYDYEELNNLTSVYLNGFSTNLQYSNLAGDDGYRLLYAVDWNCIDGDYDDGLNLILEILDKSDFKNKEDISNYLDSIIPSLDPGKSDALSLANSIAVSGISGFKRFNNYFNTKEFYNFIIDVNNRLKNEAGYDVVLAEKLESIKNQIVHKDNLITISIGNEEAIRTAENINDTVLNKLPSIDNEKAVYNFENTDKTTGVIVENTNQSSFLISGINEDFEGKYIPFIRMINDLYIVPTFRFVNGAYSTGSSFTKEVDCSYMYSYTYSDPNVAKTVEDYDNMINAVRDMDITQEQLDAYIVSAYSGFVEPNGEYMKAMMAVNYELFDIDWSTKKGYAEGIKEAKVEDMDEALDCLQAMLDNRYVAIVGNSEAINKDKSVFDNVIDLRSSVQ